MMVAKLTENSFVDFMIAHKTKGQLSNQNTRRLLKFGILASHTKPCLYWAQARNNKDSIFLTLIRITQNYLFSSFLILLVVFIYFSYQFILYSR